ncbi:uncharacterized protein LOC112594704 isoform X2 [Melanaphis sacchari]|uniref:uncharacterized protein LOC112594704 isoform X2 n=1 Tax=Melanaphis sacchari TaxID=742174 RepID=UPI000DC14E10|nr:uncharacterized protein LOC112594704 isoform X2 [Melanaphis sacchari]
MIFLKITIISAMVITLATAWSGQFPQFYNTFSSPTRSSIAFRPFFQEPMLSQRYFVHQPQFRQPLELYQPLTPPPTVMRQNLLPPRVLPTSLTPQEVTTTGVHHHVFHYYFYLPAKGETSTTGRRGDNGGQVARQPCGDWHPIATTECPPVYLPPLPSPTPPVIQTPTPTTPVPPPSQSPCNDDTVVVDNVEYYPLGRTPIVVTPVNGIRNGSENKNRDSFEQNHVPRIQPNFILANYLLPPDK